MRNTFRSNSEHQSKSLLQYPKQFDLIINNDLEATKNLNMTVRFHANDSFKYIEKKYAAHISK